MLKFGTGGFRGIIGDDFSKNNIKLIAQAVSVIYKERNYKKPIYIGCDYRFLSESAATWIGETLAANGIKVVICESTTTTPEVMYVSKARNSDFGMILPVPPMAGLQGIFPTASILMVNKIAESPSRAAAKAASMPA